MNDDQLENVLQTVFAFAMVAIAAGAIVWSVRLVIAMLNAVGAG